MRGTPGSVVIDTGPIVALFDADDTHHTRALSFLRRSRAELITAMPVVTEAMYLLEPGLHARKNLLVWIQRGGVTLVEPEPNDLDRVIQLMEKYADLPMDFTDGVLVALCERLGIRHVATIDRDFSIYRYKGRSSFINMFLNA